MEKWPVENQPHKPCDAPLFIVHNNSYLHDYSLPFWVTKKKQNYPSASNAENFRTWCNLRSLMPHTKILMRELWSLGMTWRGFSEEKPCGGRCVPLKSSQLVFLLHWSTVGVDDMDHLLKVHGSDCLNFFF